MSDLSNSTYFLIILGPASFIMQHKKTDVSIFPCLLHPSAGEDAKWDLF